MRKNLFEILSYVSLDDVILLIMILFCARLINDGLATVEFPSKECINKFPCIRLIKKKKKKRKKTRIMKITFEIRIRDRDYA